MSRPQVAIAHDYITQRGGAERVVLAIAKAFPDAPIYTTLYDPSATYDEFTAFDVRTSWLNRLRLFRMYHRAALPLLPIASSTMNIDADVVIASSSGWAHGFRSTGQKLVYCYSPARWLYDSDRYLGATARLPVRAILSALKVPLVGWDRRAARSADRYLAISTVTRDRIRRTYGIDAAIVPAPHSVDVSDITDTSLEGAPEGGYFLVVSRLLPYKNVDKVVDAFKLLPNHRLLVVGSGPQRKDLEELAPSNVSFLEGLTDSEMRAAYRGCTGLVAASYEDFGLTPLEAAAHGKPAVVLRAGGFLDTVVEGKTGMFFDRPRADEIARALLGAESKVWDAAVLRRQAELFSASRFEERIRAAVEDLLRNRVP